MPDENVLSFIEQIKNKGIFKLQSLLEYGVKNYLVKENNEYTYFELFEKFIEILEKFGFKRTYYIEVTLLRIMQFYIPTRRLKEKLTLDEQVAFELENNNSNLPESEENEEVKSTETLAKNLFDWILKKSIEDPPLEKLKEILKKLEINIDDTSNFCHEVFYFFFLTIEEYLSQQRINSIAYKFDNFENNISGLSNSPLSKSTLTLQILRSVKSKEFHCYEKEFKFMISPFGFQDSGRFCYDRMVLLGKINENIEENDIILDETFLSQQLIILCGEQGYYLCDYSQTGLTGRKLLPDEKYELMVNSVFQLGSELFITVESINRFDNNLVIKMKVLKGCGLKGAAFYAVFKGGKKVLEFGRDPDSDIFINESSNVEKTVSRKHCKLILKDDLIYLQNIKESNGTYVNLKNSNQIEERSPSDFYFIGNQQDFLINGNLFRFIPSN